MACREQGRWGQHCGSIPSSAGLGDWDQQHCPCCSRGQCRWPVHSVVCRGAGGGGGDGTEAWGQAHSPHHLRARAASPTQGASRDSPASSPAPPLPLSSPASPNSGRTLFPLPHITLGLTPFSLESGYGGVTPAPSLPWWPQRCSPCSCHRCSLLPLSPSPLESQAWPPPSPPPL